MHVYGLVEYRLGEAIDLFTTREAAERAPADLLADEPQWKGLFGIEPIDLGDWNPN